MTTKRNIAGLVVAGALFGGAVILSQPPQFSTVSDIQAAQDAYFAKTGEYYQVKENNTKPEYEKEDVQTALGKELPATAKVNVYEGPNGKGYQIITEDADNIYAVGYGPEAADFTYTMSKHRNDVATSTK